MKLGLIGWMIAAVLALVLLAQLKFCASEPFPDASLVDSLKKEIENVDTRNNIMESVTRILGDSAENLTARLKQVQQSTDSVSRELGKSKEKLTAFANSYKMGLLDRDTLKALVNCDSLIQEQENLLGYARSLEDYADSSTRFFNDRDEIKNSIISYQKTAYDSLRAAFSRVSTNYMESLIKRTAAKPKRFSVGPAIGVGIGNGLKPTAWAGFSIQYQLFKF